MEELKTVLEELSWKDLTKDNDMLTQLIFYYGKTNVYNLESAKQGCEEIGLQAMIAIDDFICLCAQVEVLKHQYKKMDGATLELFIINGGGCFADFVRQELEVFMDETETLIQMDKDRKARISELGKRVLRVVF